MNRIKFRQKHFVLKGKFPCFKRTFYDCVQLVKIERFCQEIIRTVFHCIYRGINTAVSGKYNYRNSRRFRRYAAQDFFS